MRVAAYDPGSKHLGEVCIDFALDARPRIVLAGHVTVADAAGKLTDDGLAAVVKRCVDGWRAAGVQRVVLERVFALGAGPGVEGMRLRSMASHLIGAARVGSLLHGAALAIGIPVVTYPPRTVRAGLKCKSRPGITACVRERIDGWGEGGDYGELAPSGAAGHWYSHAYDAAAVAIWDDEVRRAPAPQKRKRGPGVKREPRAKHASDAAFDVACEAAIARVLAEGEARRAAEANRLASLPKRLLPLPPRHSRTR